MKKTKEQVVPKGPALEIALLPEEIGFVNSCVGRLETAQAAMAEIKKGMGNMFNSIILRAGGDMALPYELDGDKLVAKLPEQPMAAVHTDGAQQAK